MGWTEVRGSSGGGVGGALTKICSLPVAIVRIRGVLFEPCRLVNIE